VVKCVSTASSGNPEALAVQASHAAAAGHQINTNHLPRYILKLHCNYDTDLTKTWEKDVNIIRQAYIDLEL